MKRTVVIRGGVNTNKRPHNYLQTVVDSIRTWHAGEIVLSTWVSHLDIAKATNGLDKIVLSIDPGDGPIQQMRRQMTLYQAGVQNCTGDLIMVTRTDIVHFQDLFEIIDSQPNHSMYQFDIFDSKLVISNVMTIDPDSSEQVKTFRPCDWFHVGHRGDILKVASIGTDLDATPQKLLSKLWSEGKICTEKLWFILLFNKFHRSYKIDWSDTSEWDKYAWEVLLDNFIVVDMISTAKSINLNWAFQPQKLPCYITQQKFETRYNDICTLPS